MLLSYQLKIDDLYNIPIGNVKKFVPNFDKKKFIKTVCASLWELVTFIKADITY